jgi:hypothetical protein
MLADRMHCSLSECQQRVSYREFRTHIAWYQLQLNHPSRSDYYVMQLTDRVDNVLNTKPRTIDLNKYQIKFDVGDFKPKRLTDSMLKMAKSMWRSRLGLKKPNKS